MTPPFIATSAAAGMRLSAPVWPGWLSDLPCQRPMIARRGICKLVATRGAYAQQVPGADHRLATAAGCRPDRGPGGPGALGVTHPVVL